MQRVSESVIQVIINSWRTGTNKQYDLAWQKWVIWCKSRGYNPKHTSEVDMLAYLDLLIENGKSYSVINTHKSMLIQTLKLFNNSWCENPRFIARFMKGVFNKCPPKPKCDSTWDVSVVLRYLSALMPLESLGLKLLTYKLVALLALSNAPRSQTLVALKLSNMNILKGKVEFMFTNLLKTSRDTKFKMVPSHFENESLCVMHTLLFYVSKTENNRLSGQLLISHCTYKAVTTSTVARWLKDVLAASGINDKFKAHSFRSASVSAAFMHGCTLQEILRTADWSSAKNFKKFYLRDVEQNTSDYSRAVFGDN
ncbi:uncharacterized protein LOC130013670 [Patella vulgata]|uniref:uncharacterized protein LOC130013670 n=1 Tax=Patella vulgata TaxID=6465 RepID=UPI0024A9A4C7|nr:uncharacterized protein LOC130013670 [Patella vulgata]